MTCIKIRSFRDADGNIHAATEKFFFRCGTVLRQSGSRWLEPEEVIDLPDEEAAALLRQAGDLIEATIDKPTRPVEFKSRSEAEATSMFSPAAPGRADKAREEMDAMKEKMAEEAAKAAEEEREKIREEEREKIRAEIRAEEEAKMRAADSELKKTPDENEGSGHAPPSEQDIAENGEPPQEEPAQPARRRRRGG